MSTTTVPKAEQPTIVKEESVPTSQGTTSQSTTPKGMTTRGLKGGKRDQPHSTVRKGPFELTKRKSKPTKIVITSVRDDKGNMLQDCKIEHRAIGDKKNKKKLPNGEYSMTVPTISVLHAKHGGPTAERKKLMLFAKKNRMVIPKAAFTDSVRLFMDKYKTSDKALRISSGALEVAHECTENYMTKVMSCVTAFAKHASRKTIKEQDVDLWCNICSESLQKFGGMKTPQYYTNPMEMKKEGEEYLKQEGSGAEASSQETKAMEEDDEDEEYAMSDGDSDSDSDVSSDGEGSSSSSSSSASS